MTSVAATQNAHSSDSSNTAAAVDAEAVLNFVCKLTETVLKKSDYSLVVVDDKVERLKQLDTRLWDFNPSSFVPHNLIEEGPISANMLSAPVTLMPSLPDNFDGVVLNLAAAALPLKNNSSLPERVLEIITPDEISKQQGRDKYRIYQNLGFELIHYSI